MTLTLALLLGWRQLDVNPVVRVPPVPAMPSPNAFDDYLAAGLALVDKHKIERALNHHPAPPPLGPPGGRRLGAAANTGPDDHAYSLAQKAALVRENARALRTLRLGLAFPYQCRMTRSFSTLFRYYAADRTLAMLLSLEGQVRRARGDWAGAAASGLDALQLGGTIPRGGGIGAMRTGWDCQGMGRRRLWADIGHLNAAQAQAAARRLERIEAGRVSCADALQDDEWFLQTAYMEVFRHTNWRAAWTRLLAQTFDDKEDDTPLYCLRLALTSKRAVMGNCAGYLNRFIAIARQPYAAHVPTPPVPTDPLNAFFFIPPELTCMCQPKPPTETAYYRSVGNEAQNALLLVSLALRAHRVRRGAYPASLAALVPAFLKAVPADPFASAGSLRYQRRGANYVLYSVGPDGKDGGGKATTGAAYTQDSAGDVVAGVNTATKSTDD